METALNELGGNIAEQREKNEAEKISENEEEGKTCVVS